MSQAPFVIFYIVINIIALACRTGIKAPSDPFFKNTLFISFLSIRSLRLLKVSALLLSFPGVYIILNLYCPRSSAYFIYRLLSVFVVVKLNKFLWSV